MRGRLRPAQLIVGPWLPLVLRMRGLIVLARPFGAPRPLLVWRPRASRLAWLLAKLLHAQPMRALRLWLLLTWRPSPLHAVL